MAILTNNCVFVTVDQEDVKMTYYDKANGTVQINWGDGKTDYYQYANDKLIALFKEKSQKNTKLDLNIPRNVQ